MDPKKAILGSSPPGETSEPGYPCEAGQEETLKRLDRWTIERATKRVTLGKPPIGKPTFPGSLELLSPGMLLRV